MENKISIDGVVHSRTIIENSLVSISDEEKALCGLDTGYSKLNEFTLGISTGMVVLMGRPSMGKTAFALQLTRNFLKEVPVLFFSLEMSKESLIRRILSAETGIPLKSLRLGGLNGDQWDKLTLAATTIDNGDLFISDTPSMTPEYIIETSKQFSNHFKEFVVVVDYLQYIKVSSRFSSREQEVAHISHSMKSLSKILDIPVLLLAQMSRESEKRVDKRPILSDLRESGSIEQDADVVMSIHRPARFREHEDYQGQTFIDVLKNRDGEIGVQELIFIPEKQLFLETEPGDYQEHQFMKNK